MKYVDQHATSSKRTSGKQQAQTDTAPTRVGRKINRPTSQAPVVNTPPTASTARRTIRTNQAYGSTISNTPHVPHTPDAPHNPSPTVTDPNTGYRKEIRTFFLNCLLYAVCVWALFTFVFGCYIQSGEEMYPRMRDGDFALYFRLTPTYEIDDILTFQHEDTRHTARYIAMAGDVIELTEEGQLLINGYVQDEEIFYATYPLESAITYPYTVPPNSTFLLGDFRTNAIDSRVYGAIPIDDIDGKVITILRRRGI